MHKLIAIAVSVLSLIMVSPITAISAEPPVSSPASKAAQSMLRRTIDHDLIEREYFVHIPENANPGQNLPVVVAVHGYTSTATGFQASHDVNRHADKHGYIVVYPQGTHFAVEGPQGSSYRVTSWNDLASNQPPKPVGPHCTAESDHYPCPPECGECNRCAWTSCYDDVGFISKMLDAVQAEFATDTQRYYLLGVSNGGMMTLRLGCDLSDRFAAIAPIIGQLAPGYDCSPSVDLPMLHLFGGQDDTVRFDGKPAADGFIYTTAAETARVWAESMSCNIGPKRWENEYSRNAGVECTAYSGCERENHEVVSCMDADGHHVWPSQSADGVPATCVTAEQYESMPGQPHCQTPGGEYHHEGMDLVWAFMSRYRSATRKP